MSGTLGGGRAAAETNKRLYGDDYFRRIGTIGGQNSRTGGFAAGAKGRERARIWGAVGGSISRRGHKITLSEADKQKIRNRYIKNLDKNYQKLLRIQAKAKNRNYA